MNAWHPALPTALLCVVAAPSLHAAEGGDIQDLRRELAALKAAYASRIAALEERLETAEAMAREARARAAAGPAPAATTPGVRTRRTDNAFNPAISAVLQGSLNAYEEDPETYVLPGVPLGGEAGLPAEGLTLDETEITLSANVDHLFYGEITIGLHEDEDGTEVDVEEAFVDTLALPRGVGLRAGRFYSDLGYLNKFHPHAWDFRDEPLVYRGLLGGQYRDDGLRLSWIAPTDLYLRLGGELLRGDQFPGAGADDDFGDNRVVFTELGGDVGTSHSWQVGLSRLWARPDGRGGGGHRHGDGLGTATLFTGDSDLTAVDVVWKWAPDGNPRRRSLTLQGEYLQRDEEGTVAFSEDDAAALLDYDGEQAGWYGQAVYRFHPAWRAGIRYDRLEVDNELEVASLTPGTIGLDVDEALEESGYLDEGHDPERWSVMVDWSPSEFSRWRLQYNRDDSRPGATDDQWTLQYIMSLGSHGSHEY